MDTEASQARRCLCRDLREHVPEAKEAVYLGHGSYGSVFSVSCGDGEQWVAKVVFLKSSEEEEEFTREAELSLYMHNKLKVGPKVRQWWIGRPSEETLASALWDSLKFLWNCGLKFDDRDGYTIGVLVMERLQELDHSKPLSAAQWNHLYSEIHTAHANGVWLLDCYRRNVMLRPPPPGADPGAKPMPVLIDFGAAVRGPPSVPAELAATDYAGLLFGDAMLKPEYGLNVKGLLDPYEFLKTRFGDETAQLALAWKVHPWKALDQGDAKETQVKFRYPRDTSVLPPIEPWTEIQWRSTGFRYGTAVGIPTFEGMYPRAEAWYGSSLSSHQKAFHKRDNGILIKDFRALQTFRDQQRNALQVLIQTPLAFVTADDDITDEPQTVLKVVNPGRHYVTVIDDSPEKYFFALDWLASRLRVLFSTLTLADARLHLSQVFSGRRRASFVRGPEPPFAWNSDVKEESSLHWLWTHWRAQAENPSKRQRVARSRSILSASSSRNTYRRRTLALTGWRGQGPRRGGRYLRGRGGRNRGLMAHAWRGRAGDEPRAPRAEDYAHIQSEHVTRCAPDSQQRWCRRRGYPVRTYQCSAWVWVRSSATGRTYRRRCRHRFRGVRGGVCWQHSVRF